MATVIATVFLTVTILVSVVVAIRPLRIRIYFFALRWALTNLSEGEFKRNLQQVYDELHSAWRAEKEGAAR